MKPYKDFKVLLVYPNFPMASVLLPAGVSMLSAVLKKEGFQCKLFDTTLYKPKGESQEEFRKKLHQLKTSSNMEEKVNTKITDPHDDFKILSPRKFYRRFPWKIVKLSMIFLEASPRG